VKNPENDRYPMDFVLKMVTPRGSATVTLNHERMTDVYIMNDTGKTIEHIWYGPFVGGEGEQPPS
jgi:hypothetical protein